MIYSTRRSYRLNVIRQALFSIPHYFGELAELRSVRDWYGWFYYKWPFPFPLATFPLYVGVEVTNSCNFACPHCWRSRMHRPIGFLDVDLFRKIVAEIGDHRPVTLKLAGSGEVALHPGFRDLMGALKDLPNIRVFVYTNGSLLQRFSHREILEWNINTLVVSIDGTDPASYTLHRPGGDYSVLRKQVVDFYALRNRLSQKLPKIEIRHVIMPDETNLQLMDFRKNWLTTADTVKFNYLQALDRKELTVGLPSACRLILREFSVEWDGRARFCNSFPEYLGDLHSATIRDLWNSPEATFVRNCHRQRNLDQIPACKGCAPL